jgi:hypothetical protein
MTIHTKLIGTIVLGAALLAPVAQAQSPDDRAGVRGPGAFEQSMTVSHPDNRGEARGPGAIANRPASSIRPDDRAGMRGTGAFTTGTTSNASSHPDNRAGARGPGAVATQPTTAIAVRPDDRGGTRGPGAYASPEAAASHPDNRAETRGPGAFTTTVVVESTSNSFDWRDALIGGIGGVGTALLLTGCLFLLMSQRNKARMA